ncbi:hypothetical protein HBI81_231520 [Parastagonospora nodorum]|nr:hypothetical protein HBI81_231520 [Parastagonospora nodorum]
MPLDILICAPLDESKRQIRLLHILPRHSSDSPDPQSPAKNVAQREALVKDPIKCTFSLISLSNPPPFEALSYTWGSPEAERTIEVEGHEVSVTDNLYSALQHLRQGRERIMWIDALCINQDDLNERTNQVAQMQYIYSLASTVTIFLGEAWEGSDVAMGFLQQMHADPKLHFDPFLDPHIEIQGMGLQSDILRDHLISFFSLPWFTRVWTIQEYVLAQQITIQCGALSINGDIFLAIFNCFEIHVSGCCQQASTFWNHRSSGPFSLSDHIEAVLLMNAIKTHRAQMPVDIIFLASKFWSRRCFDPRDKFYGVSGLLGHAGIRADYTIPPAELYTRVAVNAIRQSRSLDILTYMCGERESTFSLSSFVPDWTASLRSGEYDCVAFRIMILSAGLYNACRGSSADFNLLTSDQATTLGVVVDTIAEIVSSEEISGDEGPELQRLASRFAGDPRGRYGSGGNAFWRTMCGDTMRHNYKHRRAVDADCLVYVAWRRYADSQDYMRPNDGIVEFSGSYNTVRIGRKFCITSGGYIGWVPFASAPGDMVVIMPGGKIPYILRPFIDDGAEEAVATWDAGWPENPTVVPHYTFIGDAYIHGIMDGEAYDEEKLEPLILH